MQLRDIVVIGGSAGSLEALLTIVARLPSDFPASIFVVMHVPADHPSLLAGLLEKSGYLPAVSPVDLQPIERSQIYVARPDHHLQIQDGMIRVLRGPRENRHRPAIDPLFRTAARAYGQRVVGVILSGMLDDGSAGLYAVKQRGGIAIVQDPKDTAWPEMPSRAIAYAAPPYVLNARDIAPQLVELVNGNEPPMARNSKSKKSNGKNGNKHKAGGSSIGSSGGERATGNMEVAYPDESMGTPSVFACPECHGVLWELKDGKMVHFRCRVGHSYGAESLASELSMASESALWAAVRALEEKAAMQRRLAEGVGEETSTSRRLLDQSASDTGNARLIREMIFRGDAEEPDKSERGELQSEGKAKKIA